MKLDYMIELNNLVNDIDKMKTLIYRFGEDLEKIYLTYKKDQKEEYIDILTDPYILENIKKEDHIKLLNAIIDCNYNPCSLKVAQTKSITEKKDVDNQIKLMVAVSDIEKADFSQFFYMLSSILLESNDNQIKLINAYKNSEYKNIAFSIITDKNLSNERTIEEKIKMIEDSIEYGETVGFVEIMCNTEILKYRSFDEQMSLMQIRRERGSNVMPLITDEHILSTKTFEEQIALIKTYVDCEFCEQVLFIAQNEEYLKCELVDQIKVMLAVFNCNSKQTAIEILTDDGILANRTVDDRIKLILKLNNIEYALVKNIEVENIKVIITKDKILRHKTIDEQLSLIDEYINSEGLHLTYLIIINNIILDVLTTEEQIEYSKRLRELDKSSLSFRDIMIIITDKYFLSYRTSIDDKIKLIKASLDKKTCIIDEIVVNHMILEKRTVDQQIEIMEIIKKFDYNPDVLKIAVDEEKLNGSFEDQINSMKEIYRKNISDDFKKIMDGFNSTETFENYLQQLKELNVEDINIGREYVPKYAKVRPRKN